MQHFVYYITVHYLLCGPGLWPSTRNEDPWPSKDIARQTEKMDRKKVSASETVYSLGPSALKYYPQCYTYCMLTKHLATPTIFLYMVDCQWQQGGFL